MDHRQGWLDALPTTTDFGRAQGLAVVTKADSTTFLEEDFDMWSWNLCVVFISRRDSLFSRLPNTKHHSVHNTTISSTARKRMRQLFLKIENIRRRLVLRGRASSDVS